MNHYYNSRNANNENAENASMPIKSLKRDKPVHGGNSSVEINTRKKAVIMPLSMDDNTSSTVLSSGAFVTTKNKEDDHSSVANDNPSSISIEMINLKVDQLSEKIDNLSSLLSSIPIMDLVNELEKEKEKVKTLSQYTKDCIDMNDQLAEENESMKKKIEILNSEVKEYSLLYRCFKDSE